MTDEAWSSKSGKRQKEKIIKQKIIGVWWATCPTASFGRVPTIPSVSSGIFVSHQPLFPSEFK